MSNNSSIPSIAVIGTGAWGTALAQVFAMAGHNIRIYSHNKAVADEINFTQRNSTYLPKLLLSKKIKAFTAPEAAVKDADIILNVVPTQYTREILNSLKPYISEDAFIVNCSKGIEISSKKLISEIIKEILPNNPYAVLSGPTFADEVARGLPTAVTLASSDINKAKELAKVLSSETFRPYASDDVIGAEIAAAVKNVIAIACGMVGGKQLGNNAKAAIIARGMAEIKRIGTALGAKSETFLGLSGLGDLTLTCNSTMSRNYSLGFSLGEGKSIEYLMNGRKTVAEGYFTAKAVIELATSLNVDIPVCQAIYAILYKGISVDEMAKELMARHLKSENI